MVHKTHLVLMKLNAVVSAFLSLYAAGLHSVAASDNPITYPDKGTIWNETSHNVVWSVKVTSLLENSPKWFNSPGIYPGFPPVLWTAPSFSCATVASSRQVRVPVVPHVTRKVDVDAFTVTLATNVNVSREHRLVQVPQVNSSDEYQIASK